MLLWVPGALALDQVEGADTLAAGSAAVAHPLSNAAITANPAALGLDERYTFSIAAGYGERGAHWNLGVVDGKTTGVAMGLVYSGDRYAPDLTVDELPGWQVPGQAVPNRKRYDDVALGLAIPFADRKASLGFGGALSFYRHDRQGKGVTGNLTAGFAARPDDAVAFGVTGRNLLPLDSPGREPEILGGLWVGDEGVGWLGVDGGVQLDGGTPLLLAAGGEARLGAGGAARAGWRLEDGRHHAAIGVGAGNADAALDLGLQVPIDALTELADWTAVLSVRFAGPDVDSVRPD